MLTVAEAARMSSRNPETIRRWIRAGRLPARKFGTQHMIDPDDLGPMLKELGIEPRAPRPPSGAGLDPVAVIREMRADRSMHLAEVLAPYVASADSAPAPPDESLPAIVGRIVRLIDPVRIVLFGSRASGHARPDSDYDLLVVLDDVGHRRDTRIAISRALADMPISKDVVVATRDEVEANVKPVGIVGWALAEGRSIYERP